MFHIHSVQENSLLGRSITLEMIIHINYSLPLRSPFPLTQMTICPLPLILPRFLSLSPTLPLSPLSAPLPPPLLLPLSYPALLLPFLFLSPPSLLLSPFPTPYCHPFSLLQSLYCSPTPFPFPLSDSILIASPFPYSLSHSPSPFQDFPPTPLS